MAVVPVLSLVVPEHYLALPTLLLSLLLFSFVKRNRGSEGEMCVIVPYLAARSLLCHTGVSVAIELVRMALDFKSGVWISQEWHGHTALYITLIFFVVTLATSKRTWNTTFCADCLLRNGLPQERERLGHAYVRDNHYLMNRLMGLTGILLMMSITIVALEQCGIISASRSEWVLATIPAVVIVADSCGLRVRCRILRDIRENEMSSKFPYGGKFKIVRVLLFDSYGIFTVETDGRKDTPFEYAVPYSQTLTSDFVLRKVEESLRAKNCGLRIRFCYATVDSLNERAVVHYLCFMPERDAIPGLGGRWLSQDETEECFNRERLSGMLGCELYRIYAVMRTSKLYWLDGKRKIGIKGYTPKFSFEELRNTDIDFNDGRWMLLYRFNRDMPFYKLKKTWHRYMEGMN